VWLTVWDAAVDAAEFYDALGEIVPKRYPPARAGTPAPPGATSRSFAVDAMAGEHDARAVLIRAADVGGRPVVLYVDAPAGAGVDLIDLPRVTLRD
jgi:hypothetical protein